ncbi:hypothetical protein Tsubulata_032496 [Turnera subulata]|uniref:Uncharacterized protein n=1 Tax=Turnera subulata TaxID=218843 RepID=A0A9Q0J5C8_9ROSI|nr:hypothetical protein Tsubulata_032496 [Turnera subulata]
MALGKGNQINRGHRVSSLDEVDPYFYNKIMSRRSSVSHSSRFISSYNPSPGMVPLGWEREPGQPKYQPDSPTTTTVTVSPKFRKLDSSEESSKSSCDVSASDEDFFSSDDFDEATVSAATNTSSSAASFPSPPRPSSTCMIIQKPKVPFRRKARGFMKWVFAKAGK